MEDNVSFHSSTIKEGVEENGDEAAQNLHQLGCSLASWIGLMFAIHDGTQIHVGIIFFFF